MLGGKLVIAKTKSMQLNLIHFCKTNAKKSASRVRLKSIHQKMQQNYFAGLSLCSSSFLLLYFKAMVKLRREPTSVTQAGVKLRSGRQEAGGRRKSVDSQNGDKVGSFVQSGVEERFMFSDRKSRAKYIPETSRRDTRDAEERNERVNKTGKRRLSFWMDVYWLCTYARVGERVPN